MFLVTEDDFGNEMSMKTFWTEGTVNRLATLAGTRSHDWLRGKQTEFEKRFGVNWSVSHQHGGYQFSPVDEGVPVHGVEAYEQTIVRAYKEMPRPAITGYVSYWEVFEKTGMDLRVIMGVVKDMEKRGYARRTVNRMGKGFAFKIVKV